MSIDAPQNKMMIQPAIKKGYHFASDGLHFAQYIEAETIEEATAIYHKIKRLIDTTGQSTPAPEPEEKVLE
jgi:hypothetical protein